MKFFIVHKLLFLKSYIHNNKLISASFFFSFAPPTHTRTHAQPLFQGVIVFVTARAEDADGNGWLQIADGWVQERQYRTEAAAPSVSEAAGSAGGATSESPSLAGTRGQLTLLVPFHPGTTAFSMLNRQLEDAGQALAGSLADLLPQPADSIFAPSSASSSSSSPSGPNRRDAALRGPAGHGRGHFHGRVVGGGTAGLGPGSSGGFTSTFGVPFSDSMQFAEVLYEQL